MLLQEIRECRAFRSAYSEEQIGLIPEAEFLEQLAAQVRAHTATRRSLRCAALLHAAAPMCLCSCARMHVCGLCGAPRAAAACCSTSGSGARPSLADCTAKSITIIRQVAQFGRDSLPL